MGRLSGSFREYDYKFLRRGRQMVRVRGENVAMETEVRLIIENTSLLTLKIEGGAVSQGMQTASKKWKRQWNAASRKDRALQAP